MEPVAQPTREPDLVVSFKDGNALLGISRVTAYRWMRRSDSTLPRPFRKGGRWVYRRCDVEGHLMREGARAQVRPIGDVADYPRAFATIHQPG